MTDFTRILKNNPYRNHDGTFGSKDSSGAASQRAELKPTDGDFKGGVMREGSKPDNPHHGANKEMEAPLNLLKNGVHREGHTMAVVGSAKMPEGRYSVSFQPRAYNPRGRQHPVTVAGNFATAEDAVAYSRAYAKHHGTSTIDQATPFGDPKPDPGVKKDDLTLDGVPKKNPEQAPHKRKRIQGLDF